MAAEDRDSGDGYVAMQDRHMADLAAETYDKREIDREDLAQVLSWGILTILDQKRTNKQILSAMWDKETLAQTVVGIVSAREKELREWVLAEIRRSAGPRRGGFERLADIGTVRLSLIVCGLGLLAAVVFGGGSDIIKALIGLFAK